MRPLLAAVQFLTIIPVRARIGEHDLERAPLWFPLAGVLLGAPVALADAILGRAGFPPAVLGILSVGLLAALSGGLHLDGLADTADGFLSARPRGRVLEIMRDSRIGAMGVLALLFVLAIKVAALSDLGGAARWRALILAPMAGRSMLLAVLGTMPYARDGGGLATIFMRRRHPLLVVWAVLWLGGGSILLCGPARGLAAAAAVGAATVLFSLCSRRRIGGFTGDTLGAASEMAEAIILLMFSLYGHSLCLKL